MASSHCYLLALPLQRNKLTHFLIVYKFGQPSRPGQNKIQTLVWPGLVWSGLSLAAGAPNLIQTLHTRHVTGIYLPFLQVQVLCVGFCVLCEKTWPIPSFSFRPCQTKSSTWKQRFSACRHELGSCSDLESIVAAPAKDFGHDMPKSLIKQNILAWVCKLTSTLKICAAIEVEIY